VWGEKTRQGRAGEKKTLPPEKQNDKKKNDALLDLAQTSLREDPLREKQKIERDDRQHQHQAVT
jgi:hypothetical protein